MYQSKEITKKLYNNITKSKNKTKQKKIEKVDTTFMNSEDSETSKAHVLILKLTDKIDFRRGEKSIASSNLSIYGTWKNIKNSYFTILINNLKYQPQHEIINLNYLMDHVLYQVFKTILNIS